MGGQTPTIFLFLSLSLASHPTFFPFPSRPFHSLLPVAHVSFLASTHRGAL